MTTDTKNMQARIPTELHMWLKMQTIREGTTINELVERLLREYRARVGTDDDRDR